MVYVHDLYPVLDIKQSGGWDASPSSILCSVRTGYVGMDRTIKMETQ